MLTAAARSKHGYLSSLQNKRAARQKLVNQAQVTSKPFRNGLSMEAYIELDSAEGIKQGVIGGLGIGVLSKHSLRLELEAGELVVLDVAGFPLRRRWYVSHREGKRLSRAAQLFLEYLQEEGEEEVAELLALDQGSGVVE